MYINLHSSLPFTGDGAPINRWKHWFRDQPVGEPQPTHTESMIDLFPETDEYDDEDLKESTGIVLPDGSNAKFYSNVRPKVVLKHFEWMRTYGLTGVFHHRFIESIHLKNNREWKTMVLRNVKAAAEVSAMCIIYVLVCIFIHVVLQSNAE